MKLKNLKCYALGAMILVNSSFMISCDAVSEKYDRIRNKDFYDFLEENDIVCIDDLDSIPRNYYEAEISEFVGMMDDEMLFKNYYERLDRIDNVICHAREFDYDYKVLKIEKENGNYEINEKVVDNIDERPFGYEYVYPNDYVISNGYRDILINYGKILVRE